MTLVQPIPAQYVCDVSNRITPDEALSLIRATATALTETDTVPLDAALGRVLAHPIHTRTQMPPFDNAAMDGYAINTNGLEGAGPWDLSLVQTLAAGDVSSEPIATREAARTLTGAHVPDGADAVIMQEAVIANGTKVRVNKRPVPGTNIRRAGEDVALGTKILPTGKKLRPVDIAACAAAGHATVDVHRKLHVGIMASGDEVRIPGTSLPFGAIWDSNTPMLQAMLTRSDVDCQSVVRVADDPALVRSQFAELAAHCDVIVTTGGLSVGDRDFIKPAFTALHGQTVFSGVAMKPGKPVTFGKLGQAYWLGLPGNPMAACVAWLVFGRALVAKLTGRTDLVSPLKVVLSTDVQVSPGRVDFRPASLSDYGSEGRQTVIATQSTQSANVAQMAACDGFVRLLSENAFIEAGTVVEFVPLDEE